MERAMQGPAEHGEERGGLLMRNLLLFASYLALMLIIAGAYA